MSNFKVVRVEKLGALCAFKPKEIQVVGALYDRVPQEQMSDFETVLNKAKELYDFKVADVKASGEKPKATSLKSEALDEVLTPWLERTGINNAPKRVVSRNPRIVSGSDKTEVAASIDIGRVTELYDNFPSDELSDGKVEEAVLPEDDIFEDGDSLDSGDVADIFGDSEDLFEDSEDLDSNGVLFVDALEGVNFDDLM